jgi:hypothetical protein
MATEFSIDLLAKRKEELKKCNLFVYYRITFVVTAYRSCSETNAQALVDSIERTLIEMKTSFMTSNL